MVGGNLEPQGGKNADQSKDCDHDERLAGDLAAEGRLVRRAVECGGDEVALCARGDTQNESRVEDDGGQNVILHQAKCGIDANENLEGQEDAGPAKAALPFLAGGVGRGVLAAQIFGARYVRAQRSAEERDDGDKHGKPL